VSIPRRRRWVPAAILSALVAVAVGVGLAQSSDLPDPVTASASPSTPPGETPPEADAAGATSTAPYTVKPEPTFVATDEPTAVATDEPAPVATDEPRAAATDEPRPGNADLVVVLTYAGFESASGTVQANGYVAGTIEDGGSCTLTLTKGGQQVRATSTSIADATTTSCGLLETAPGLAAGTWEAVLSYEGTDSASTEVTVP
jgi:hypothetical protein